MYTVFRTITTVATGSMLLEVLLIYFIWIEGTWSYLMQSFFTVVSRLQRGSRYLLVGFTYRVV